MKLLRERDKIWWEVYSLGNIIGSVLLFEIVAWVAIVLTLRGERLLLD